MFHLLLPPPEKKIECRHFFRERKLLSFPGNQSMAYFLSANRVGEQYRRTQLRKQARSVVRNSLAAST